MRFEGGVLVSLHSPNWIFDHDLIEYGCAVAWLPIAGNHHHSSQRYMINPHNVWNPRCEKMGVVEGSDEV